MSNARNYAQTTVTVGTSSSVLLSANPRRAALIIFNTHATQPAKIGIDGNNTILIPAGSHLAFVDESVPMNTLTCQADSAGTLVVWEA